MAEIVALPLAALSPRVLLVEDSASDAVLIRNAIGGAGRIWHERTLESAVKALKETEYEIVLLDLSLPDSAGFDGLLFIQNLFPKMPVIILTAYADEEIALEAVQRGAQDYLFKDKMDGPTIRRAMQYAVQRKQFEATLITQANFDTLTGLANRMLLESRLEMALARMQRSGAGVGVFFLDLSRFKQVNDTHGHAVGDRLLQQVAAGLRQCVRPYDTVARFGGDEFALLVEGIAQPRDCAAVAQKILDTITGTFEIAHKKVEVGVSIGIATCFAGDHADLQAVIQHADEAMYGAKLSQASSYRFYTAEIHEEACARLKLEQELRAALKEGAMAVHYQPKIDLATGRTAGAEALIRWNHPRRGLLLPAEFMAIAEETGMSDEIGHWVLSTVCGDMARWRSLRLPPVAVAINIAASQLDGSFFLEQVRQQLSLHRVTPRLLAVEVPSDSLGRHTEKRLQTLVALRELGVGVHLDRFGMSALTLASLARLPMDAIKIAPELTRAMHEPEGTLALVQAILDIAARFKVEVIAAGIENEWQQAFFRERHCREGQGYALCRPIPGEFIADWLGRGNTP